MANKLRTDGTCVLYTRVSSKEQEKEGYSISAQLKLLRGYAKDHGLRILEEFQDIETAKQTGRRAFKEMVWFLQGRGRRKAKKPDCCIILVEKTDRLYRNFKDYVILDELDLDIHFVKEGVVLSQDSNSSEKFMHGIKVLMAKNFIDNLSEETRKGMLEKAEQGIYPSYAPMGYINVLCNDQRFIQPDPDAAMFIRRLFELYSTGRYSVRQLSRMMADEGFKSRQKGNRIQNSTIHKILTNPLYHGDFRWAGKQYNGIHEPIISKELFDSVQEKMSVRGNHRRKQRKHTWAFQGLLRCGHCGCALVAEVQKKQYIYYHCTGAKGKCPEKYVREEEVDRQFLRALRAIQIDGDVLDWVVMALKESQVDERRFHTAQVSSLQAQHSKLTEKIDALYVDRLEGNVDGQFFQRKFEEWRNEQDGIRQRIERLEKADRSYQDEGARIFELSQKAAGLYVRQEMAEKRRLLQIVFSNSTWRDGTLAPEYRKPFDSIAVTNAAYQQKKTADFTSGDLSEIWLPGPDSNRQRIG